MTEAASRLDTFRALFSNLQYRRYWASAAVFGLSIWAFITAMGWTALELTDSAFRVSMVNVLYFLPMFLLAILSGVLADIWNRRRIVIVSRGGSALLVGVMAAMAATDRLTYLWLCFFAFGVGASVVLELAARQAMVAQIVEPSRLIGATSLTSIQGGLSRVFGPMVVGWLIAARGDAAGYVFFAVCNVFVVYWFFRIRVDPVPVREDRVGMLDDLRRGLVYLRDHRDARAIVTLSILAGIVGWVYIAMLPLMARDVLGGDAATHGSLSTAVGLGSVPGSVALAFSIRVRHEGAIYVGSVLVWGVGVILFSLSTWLPLSLVALTIAGLGFGLQTVLTRSLLLRIVDPAYHGRVLGTLLLTYGANIVGTLGGGSLAELTGVPVTVGISGGLIVAAALAISLWHRPLWRL